MKAKASTSTGSPNLTALFGGPKLNTPLFKDTLTKSFLKVYQKRGLVVQNAENGYSHNDPKDLVFLNDETLKTAIPRVIRSI